MEIVDIENPVEEPPSETHYSLYLMHKFFWFSEKHKCKQNLSFEQYHEGNVSAHHATIRNRWREQFAKSWRECRIESVQNILMPPLEKNANDSENSSDTSTRIVADPLFDAFVSEHIVPLVVDYEDGFGTLADEIVSSFQLFIRNSASTWHASCYNILGWIETVGLTIISLLGIANSILLPYSPPDSIDIFADEITEFALQFATEQTQSIHKTFYLGEIRVALTIAMLGVLIVHMTLAWRLFEQRRQIARHFECMVGHKESIAIVRWILEGFNLPNPLVITRVIPNSITPLFGPITVVDEEHTFVTVCPSRLRRSRVMWLTLPYFVAAVWLISILNQHVAVWIFLFGPVGAFVIARVEVIEARLAPYGYLMWKNIGMAHDELETIAVESGNVANTTDLLGGETTVGFEDDDGSETFVESVLPPGMDTGGDSDDEDGDLDFSFRNYLRNRRSYEAFFDQLPATRDLNEQDWHSNGCCCTCVELRAIVCLDSFMLLSVYPLLLMLPFTMSIGLLCEIHVMWEHEFAFQYFVHYWYLFLGVKIAFGTVISTCFHCFSPSDWIGPRDVFYALSFWSLSFSSVLIFLAQFFGSRSAIAYVLRCFLWLVFYVWAKSFSLMRIQSHIGRRDISATLVTHVLCWFQTSILESYNVIE